MSETDNADYTKEEVVISMSIPAGAGDYPDFIYGYASESGLAKPEAKQHTPSNVTPTMPTVVVAKHTPETISPTISIGVSVA